MTKAMRCCALAEAANSKPHAAIATRLNKKRRSIVIPKGKAGSNLGSDCSGFRAENLRNTNRFVHRTFTDQGPSRLPAASKGGTGFASGARTKQNAGVQRSLRPTAVPASGGRVRASGRANMPAGLSGGTAGLSIVVFADIFVRSRL